MSESLFKLSVPLPSSDWADSTYENDLLPSMIHIPTGIQVMVDSEDYSYMKAEFGTDTEQKLYRFYIANWECSPNGFDTVEEVVAFINTYVEG